MDYCVDFGVDFEFLDFLVVVVCGSLFGCLFVSFFVGWYVDCCEFVDFYWWVFGDGFVDVYDVCFLFC